MNRGAPQDGLVVRTNADKRKQRVTFLLLISLSLLSLFAASVNVFSYVHSEIFHWDFKGIEPFVLLVVASVIIYMAFISRKAYSRISAIGIVVLLCFGAGMTAFQWGPHVPQSQLTFALAIILAGIIIKPRAAFVVAGCMYVFLFLITLAHQQGVIVFDLSWRKPIVFLQDTIIVGVTFMILSLISYFSQNENDTLINKLMSSETKLAYQKKKLITELERVTADLIHIQQNEMRNTYAFAHLGRQAAGLVHDLLNPITALGLNLDEINSKSNKVSNEMRDIIREAMTVTEFIEQYVISARNNVNHTKSAAPFSMRQTLFSISSLFKRLFNNSHINFTIDMDKDITLVGDSAKFCQIVCNVIQNSYESFEQKQRNDKRVSVRGYDDRKDIIVEIEDNGRGMKKSSLDNIGKHFNSDKPNARNSGIGMSLTMNLMQDEFGGRIEVKSVPKKGTTVLLRFSKDYVQK